MFKCVNSFWQFLNYWYFRYLMVTELYMVEKWERAVCNITIVIFLSILSYCNCFLLRHVSGFINSLISTTTDMYNSSIAS